MQCTACGATLSDDAAFCHRCGSPLEADADRIDRQRAKTFGKKTKQSRPDERIVDSGYPTEEIELQAVYDARRGAVYKAEPTPSPVAQASVTTPPYAVGAYAEEGAVVPVVDVPTPANFLENERKRKRRRRILGILALLVIAALAAAIGLEVQRQRSAQETARIIAENNAKIEAVQQQAVKQTESQTAQEELVAERPVLFTVNGVNYNTAGTRIPVHVHGADIAGETVDIDTYIDAAGAGLSLAPGNYALTVNASPIASTGMLYTIPTEPIDLYIAQGSTEPIRAARAITLLPIDVTSVSQSMIDNAYSWAVADVAYQGKAETCRAAAETALAEAENIRQAEADRAARRALRPALAQEFVSNYFTNVIFADLNDDSKIMGISNWDEVVYPYVAPGTQLAANIAGRPLDGWYVTRSASVVAQDDTSVTVAAEVASAPEPFPGWTASGWQVSVKCTFDDDNNITAATFTTSASSVNL